MDASGSTLKASVNAGGRLDRLPISAFHYRVFTLVAIGMFFDGFDIYLAGNVLGATLKSGFSTLGQNAAFVSVTFVGMTVGSFVTGFLGDRYGRRFTYQANLAVFGLASLASAFAPSMTMLTNGQALQFAEPNTVSGLASQIETSGPLRRTCFGEPGAPKFSSRASGGSCFSCCPAFWFGIKCSAQSCLGESTGYGDRVEPDGCLFSAD